MCSNVATGVASHGIYSEKMFSPSLVNQNQLPMTSGYLLTQLICALKLNMPKLFSSVHYLTLQPAIT